MRWGSPEIDGFKSRLKFFDYGVVSLALTRPFSGDWPDLIALSQKYIENDALEQRAEDVCRAVCRRFSRALRRPRATYLSEDYLVFAVTALEGHSPAEQLVLTPRRTTSRCCCAASASRSASRSRTRCSGTGSRTWPTISSCRRGTPRSSTTPKPGAQAALEILEFANSQLLEFRYYDELLDRELAQIYAQLQQPAWFDMLVGGRYTRRRAPAARAVHRRQRAHRPDRERAEVRRRHLRGAAVQPVGGRASGSTLEGERRGQARRRSTTSTASPSSRSAMARGQFLELTIVLILVFELVLFFLGDLTMGIGDWGLGTGWDWGLGEGTGDRGLGIGDGDWGSGTGDQRRDWDEGRGIENCRPVRLQIENVGVRLQVCRNCVLRAADALLNLQGALVMRNRSAASAISKCGRSRWRSLSIVTASPVTFRSGNCKAA